MKRTLFLLISTLIILLGGCYQESKDPLKNKFTGLWKLDVIEQYDSITDKWSMFLDGLQGYILYDDKDNMAVHLTTKGYQNSDIIFNDFADSASAEELKHRLKSYVYFAKYSLIEDEGIVEHARISHSNPNLWNTVAKRYYEFKGDTLILTTAKNEPLRLRVKWIRY